MFKDVYKEGDKMFTKKIKDIMNVELEKFKEVSYLITSLLLIMRFANDFTPFDSVLYSVLLISFICWIGANLYTKVLQMHKHNREAKLYFNKYMVYALTPYQRMIMLNQGIPMLQHHINKTNDEDEKKILYEKLLKLKRWTKDGYIRKDEFPEYLKKYYVDKE